MKKKLELVGHVGVDTGKLLIADPDYVESLWVRDTEPPGHPLYALTPEGKKKFPNAPAPQAWPFPWGNYDDPSPHHSGLSMNDMREQGLVMEVDRDPTGEFSLNGACLAVDKERTGSLKNDIGRSIGFVTSTGYGDGVYPIYIRKDQKTGRVAELVIKFMED